MKHLLFMPLISLSLAIPAFVEQKPIAYPTDPRIKLVVYQTNNVVPLYGKTFTNTQIVFGKGEAVLDVEGGDRDGWIVTSHKRLPNMLFVKPTLLGSRSNMTVVTTKHTYYFFVTSNVTLKNKPLLQTYAIKFVYPEEARARLNAQLKQQAHAKKGTAKPILEKHYHWDYTFSGNPQVKPLHVFDDGTFTYFQLQPNQSVPAIFAVDSVSGKEALINFRKQGKYIVVQRTAPQFTLRQGSDAVASVFNAREINRIKRGV